MEAAKGKAERGGMGTDVDGGSHFGGSLLQVTLVVALFFLEQASFRCETVVMGGGGAWMVDEEEDSMLLPPPPPLLLLLLFRVFWNLEGDDNDTLLVRNKCL